MKHSLLTFILVTAFAAATAIAEPDREDGRHDTKAAQDFSKRRMPENPEDLPQHGTRPSGQNHSQPLLGNSRIRRRNAVRGRKTLPNQAFALHPLSDKLHRPGITQQPHRFSNKAQILNTDHVHSVVKLPSRGIDGLAISDHSRSLRNFNDPTVHDHMAMLVRSASGFSGAHMNGELNRESTEGRYYWHHSQGFDYCHYNDAWGYSWYGWYFGEGCFWTRYYGNRWWVYDDGNNRWNYWSAGAWWWQDPTDLSREYIYVDGIYVAAEFAPGPP